MHLELLWPQQKTQLWKISQQIDNDPGRIWVLCGAEKQNRALSFCDTRVSVCDSHRSLQSTSHHRKKPKILTSFFVFFEPIMMGFCFDQFFVLAQHYVLIELPIENAGLLSSCFLLLLV